MSLTGWGRGTWGEGAWNQSVPLAVTGVAGTTALGSPTVQNVLEIPVTGVAGTGAVGTVTTDCQAVVVPTGVQGTFTIGNETINAVQFDYESIKENYSRARTVYLASHSSNTNTSYVRAA